MKTHRYCVEEYALAAILAAQIVLMCAGILSRYLFNFSFSFTEELTRYLIHWLACFGVAACVYRGETIRFQWPASFQSTLRATRWWMQTIVASLFFLALFYSACLMIAMQIQFNQTTSVMGWPIVWVSFAITAMCLFYAARSTAAWRNTRRYPA